MRGRARSSGFKGSALWISAKNPPTLGPCGLGAVARFAAVGVGQNWAGLNPETDAKRL